jgi:3-hydroxyacyl-CoA dehydrogenase/enoyl-CoA hydratase/3-hydroxybutyryl-CoA epimerase
MKETMLMKRAMDVVRGSAAGTRSRGGNGRRAPDAGLRLTVDKSGVAAVVFDEPGRVNVLSAAVLTGLDRLLDDVTARREIRALVFRSAQPGIFIAGADLREIRALGGAAEAVEKSRLGQEIITKIERLPFPTAAVIDGACLGGGLELALACRFRLVSDSPRTKLGLPETTLGIIPGFGGTYRLPRLVGLQRALDLILTGRPVSGEKAARIGLADACFPQAFLEERAAAFLQEQLGARATFRKKRRRRFSQQLLEGNPLGRAVLRGTAKKRVLSKTRGFYPAPLAALETVFRVRGRSPARALRIERETFGRLAATDVSRRLVSIYFLNEELKKAYPAPAAARRAIEKNPVRAAAVLGAGTMGGGIAWLFSSAGLPVRMKDVSWEAVAAGYHAVRTVYDEARARGKLDERREGLALHRVSGGVDYTGFATADVVVEAIVEDREIKRRALAELEEHVGPNAIIATNTSSFSVAELAGALRRPERFIGFHFFNPVHRLPLVEVVRGPATADRTVHAMIDLARRLGKTPVLVRDCPGFLVNRVLMAYLSEAVLLMEEGQPFPAVDRALYDFGLPLGPFALLDEIGLRVAVHVAENLGRAYGGHDDFGKVFPLLGGEHGITGRSGGRGFFLYRGSHRAGPNPAVTDLLRRQGITPRPTLPPWEMETRCVMRMVVEAARCLEEGVVDGPAHLDMALVLGIGWPPFRGGLLRSVDETGAGRVTERLAELASRHGPRFEAPALLKEMARKHRRFYP